VIDTCVLESAFRSKNGASYQILQAIDSKRFDYGLSVPLVLEYEYRMSAIIEQGSSALSVQQMDAILAALVYFATEVPIYFSIRPNLRDENDNHIFECCANYNADILITNNLKDFRNADLKPYNFQIAKPKDFFKNFLL
jgi:putative PIN family toxin of toxin-antitoxin system